MDRFGVLAIQRFIFGQFVIAITVRNDNCDNHNNSNFHDIPHKSPRCLSVVVRRNSNIFFLGGAERGANSQSKCLLCNIHLMTYHYTKLYLWNGSGRHRFRTRSQCQIKRNQSMENGMDRNSKKIINSNKIKY